MWSARAYAAALISSVLPAFAQNPAVTISVDAGANAHPISPNIYGVAFATAEQLSDLNVPLNRHGGNNTSRYNWQINGDNRGQDWFFESLPDHSPVPGERVDTFISASKAGGAEPLITIPMVDWIAKLGPNRRKLSSFAQSKYGAQTGNDHDAGNGILESSGLPIANDPNDANVPNSSTYQKQWVESMVARWGPAAAGGVPYYFLDNELSIWFQSHRDVQPFGQTMDETLSRVKDYAAQIRAADPGAKIVGPEEWGWNGYFFSGHDQQYGKQFGWNFLPDRASHGGWDSLPWLLDRLKYDGRHLLDIFSVHFYPQGGEFGNDISTATQLLRNRSTRSLWDPNYVAESWIGDRVQLIPRLRNWVNTYYYPGTPIAITEYNWGAEAYINGATAQADVLGIFGREGLDIGIRWTTPDAFTPTYKAIQMYRNYDGARSTFGDVSVSARGPDPDDAAAFAALRTADGALTVMVINKVLTGATPVTLKLANFNASGPAQVFQLTALNAINRLPDLDYTGSAVAFSASAQSITLLVLPASKHPDSAVQ